MGGESCGEEVEVMRGRWMELCSRRCFTSKFGETMPADSSRSRKGSTSGFQKYQDAWAPRRRNSHLNPAALPPRHPNTFENRCALRCLIGLLF